MIVFRLICKLGIHSWIFRVKFFQNYRETKICRFCGKVKIVK